MEELRRALFTVRGRLRRFDWVVWTVGLWFVGGVLADRLDAAGSTSRLVILLSFFPQLCLDAKRLRDAGFSAWWQLPARLLSVAAFFAGGYGPLGAAADAALPNTPANWNMAVAALIGVGMVVYFALLAFAPTRRLPGEASQQGPRPAAV